MTLLQDELREKFKENVAATLEELSSLVPAGLIIDTARTVTRDLTNFSLWQFEELLNQSADLLDRCIGSKREAERLWVALADLKLQLLADEHLDNIATLETAQNVLEAGYLEAKAQSDESGYALNTLLLPWNVPDVGNFTREALLKQSIDQGIQFGSGNINAREKNNANLVRNSQVLEYFRFFSEKTSRGRAMDREEKLLSRNVLARDQAEIFRESRRKLKEKYQPYDYESRIKTICEHLILPDFNDAADRCVQAMKGLEIIHGWGMAVPYQFPNIDPSAALLGSEVIEELHSWVRQAIAWIVKQGSQDETLTLRQSLGPLAPNQAHKLDLSFHLNGYLNVRLMGVCVFVDTEENNPSAIYQAEVTLPEFASHTLYDGTVSMPPFDQRSRPPCRLGRAGSSALSRAPEIGGSSTLRNASPFAEPGSQWTVTLVPVSLAAATAKVVDVQLELLVTARKSS